MASGCSKDSKVSWSASISIHVENRIVKTGLILQEKKGNFSKSWNKLCSKIEKKCCNDPASLKISSFDIYFIDANGNKVLIVNDTDLQGKIDFSTLGIMSK